MLLFKQKQFTAKQIMRAKIIFSGKVSFVVQKRNWNRKTKRLKNRKKDMGESECCVCVCVCECVSVCVCESERERKP